MRPVSNPCFSKIMHPDREGFKMVYFPDAPKLFSHFNPRRSGFFSCTFEFVFSPTKKNSSTCFFLKCILTVKGSKMGYFSMINPTFFLISTLDGQDSTLAGQDFLFYSIIINNFQPFTPYPQDCRLFMQVSVL